MSQFEIMERNVAAQRAPKIKNRDLEEVVRSNVTYNLLPFQVRTDFIKITSDTVLALLTVQVVNKDMTFLNKDGVQHGVVNVLGRVSTLTHRVAQIFEDVVQVDVPADLLPRSLDRANLYWQALPLRPGRYRLNLVLKDVASGNLGTLEKAIVIPSFDDETLSASSLILSDKMEKVSTKDTGRGQFVVGSTKLRPSVSESFRKSDRLGFYIQVYNLGTDQETHRPSAAIEYVLWKDAQRVFEAAEKAEEIPGASARQLTLEKMLPLDSLKPGRYTLQVKVTDNIANKSITPTVSFTVQ